MEVVVIYNGLGNQMSQYAFYLAKKKYDKNCILIFDDKGRGNHNGFELDKLFNIRLSTNLKAKIAYRLLCLKKIHIVSRFLTYIGVRIIIDDKHYNFRSSDLINSKFGVNFYVGGWPSEKHFSQIGSQIRTVFNFPKQTDSAYLKWKNLIISDFNSVSIHIRRGDYLIPTKSMYQFAGVASEKYFSNAMVEVRKVIDKPSFYIFSDDISWCREKFVGEEFHFVDCNTGSNSWRDMQLMSLCRHHINSNSTFSWWAAWLCPYEEAVIICPKEYIRNLKTPDVYPNSWITIDNK